jgi:hypothetical protein
MIHYQDRIGLKLADGIENIFGLNLHVKNPMENNL